MNYLYLSQKLRIDQSLINCSLSNNQDEEYSSLFKIDDKRLSELICKYPDPSYHQLLNNLRKYYSIKNIILGAGSEDLIIRLANLMKKRGRVGVLIPNFYRIIEVNNNYEKLYLHYDLNKNYSNIQSLYQQIKNKNLKTIWISNPNPLLGKIFYQEQLCELISKFPQILFIIDEACIDFLEENIINTSIVLQESQKKNNIIVIRSFSKLYGLAGLRLAFATGKTKILNKIQYNKLTFPVNNLAAYFANIALENPQFFIEIKARIKKHKTSLEELLRSKQNKNKILLNNSLTNTLVFGCQNKNTYQKLLRAGIISTNLDNQEGIKEKGLVRITIFSSKNLYRKTYSSILRFIKKI